VPQYQKVCDKFLQLLVAGLAHLAKSAGLARLLLRRTAQRKAAISLAKASLSLAPYSSGTWLLLACKISARIVPLRLKH
jgi:hypothetical protein